jgi:hypothetical protein
MTAEPELRDDQTFDVADRVCPDCGGPIEPDAAPGKPAPVCGPCYEVYVHNAGRW